MNILITGGGGYIGSHTAVELINSGHTVIIVDNFSNSYIETITAINNITDTDVTFYNIDILNRQLFEKVFIENNFDAVIHFAGLKAVSESVVKPLYYYRNNLDITINLLELTEKYHVNNVIFSSSATVYGLSPIPYIETSNTGQGITSPYGKTKYMIEQIIKDISACNPDNNYTILRYFNPIGAHESGLIGEDPKGIPNNLMPYISQVASGERKVLSIFGGDYDTPDGTCIRDYIHVVDLAKGHVCALINSNPGYNTYNLGSGKGTSVLELVHSFINITGQNIPYIITDRRPGDLPAFYADTSKANKLLNWKAEKTIDDMCKDSWRRIQKISKQ